MDSNFVWLGCSMNKPVERYQASQLSNGLPMANTLASSYVENATRRAGALDAMKPLSGVIGEDGVEIQGLRASPWEQTH